MKLEKLTKEAKTPIIAKIAAPNFEDEVLINVHENIAHVLDAYGSFVCVVAK